MTACKDDANAGDAKAAQAGEAKAYALAGAEAGAAAGAEAGAAADEKAADDPAGEVDCESAAKNLMAIMKPELEKQLAQVPEDQKAMAEQQMKAEFTLEKLTEQCKQQGPGKEELKCVTNAKTSRDLQACQGPPPPPGGMPPGHPAPPPGAAPGGPAGPAPGDPPGTPEPPPAGDAQ